jgi:hypothetical protein
MVTPLIAVVNDCPITLASGFASANPGCMVMDEP